MLHPRPALLQHGRLNVFTQCSKCETVFSLSAEVLRAAGGQVRCGRCGEVFNAVARLAEDSTAFTVGESALELETRADEILHSARPIEPAATIAPKDPVEKSRDTARLQILEPLFGELGSEATSDETDENLDALLEFTLPPGELDRVFIDTRPRPPQPTTPKAAPASVRTPTPFRSPSVSPPPSSAPTPSGALTPSSAPGAIAPAPKTIAAQLVAARNPAAHGHTNAVPPIERRSGAPTSQPLPPHPEASRRPEAPRHPEPPRQVETPRQAEGARPIDRRRAPVGPIAPLQDDVPPHPEAPRPIELASHPEASRPIDRRRRPVSPIAPLQDDVSPHPEALRQIEIPRPSEVPHPEAQALPVVQPAAVHAESAADPHGLVGIDVPENVRLEMLAGFEHAELPAINPPRRSVPFIAWLAAAAALTIVLAVQVFYANREWFAAHAPIFSVAAVTAPNLSAYQLRQWGVGGDPSASGTLRLRASILNGAAQLQPYPLLRVTFANRFGSHVGARDFEPAEYLGKPTARMLAPNERVDVTLDILDPGKDAEGFEIDVCVRDSDRKVICAADSGVRPSR